MNTNDFNLRENADIVALAMDAAKSLDSRPLKEWFDKKYSSVEPRVYVIDTNDERVDNVDLLELTDEEFMFEAEEQGRIYTLEGFTEAFNLEEINSSLDVIRIIQVPVFV